LEVRQKRPDSSYAKQRAKRLQDGQAALHLVNLGLKSVNLCGLRV
jgi:hypothetical protein